MQVFYALGPGICVWLVLSELMPQQIRANGMAIALFMNQFVANGVLYSLVACFIPETKGKSSCLR